jgi:hypothetical protein
MNNAINELVRSIVKKNSLAECSVSELQKLTTQYPYFGPVQFLLAKKLKEENSSQYARQSQKAILYFQDDMWFDYVTSNRINEAVFSKGNNQAEVATEIKKPAIAEPEQPVQPIEPLMAAAESVQTRETPVETVDGPVEKIEEYITDTVIPRDEIIVDEPEEKITEPVIEPVEERTERSQEQIEPVGPAEEITGTPIEQFEPIELAEERSETPIEQLEPIELAEERTETPIEQFEPIELAEERTEHQIEQLEPIELAEERTETPIEQPGPVVHEKAPVEYDDGISSSIQQPQMEVNEPAQPQPVEPMGSEDINSEEDQEEEISANTELPPLPGLKIEAFNPDTAKLSFEPYHTVDYFASLGIKFKGDEKPKDKFGQQLKSFTEWLKTLKKVPETGGVVTANGPEDRNVTKLAEHSLVEGEVVTEAMADVWEKQGKFEKAIETYRKLSLLNPSKSAYFAAKIDHLKQV